MAKDYLLSPTADTTCEICPLQNSRFVSKQVPTEVHPGDKREGKNLDVDVMFIAEAPGGSEDKIGRPFIGATGLILRNLVWRINGSEKGVAYGNIVRCRPTQPDDPSKDRTPLPKEVASCRPNILNDIMRIKPKHIVLLGASAVTGLASYKNTKEPVAKDSRVFELRGREFIVRTPDGSEYPATATFHFAFIARSPNLGGVFEDDVTRAFYKAKGVLTDYSQRGKPTVLVDSVDRVEKLLTHMVRNLKPHQVVALDYETVGLNRIGNTILTVGFAYDTDRAYVIPYKHQNSPWNKDDFQRVRHLLKKFFTTKQVSFRSIIAHNLKFECAMTLDEFGVNLWHLPIECTMLRAHALNENRTELQEAFGLKVLSDEQLGFTGYYDADMRPVLKLREDGKLEEADFLKLVEYNGMDCYVEARLFYQQEEIARYEGYDLVLKRLGLNLLGPVSMFAAIMERNGMKADKEQLRYLMRNDSPIAGRMQKIVQEMKALPSVRKVNELLLVRNKKTLGMRGIWGKQLERPWLWDINKPDARQTLFLEVLGLSTTLSKKTEKPQFDKKFWKSNKGVKEVDLTSEWTSLSKLHGTYVKGPYMMLQRQSDMRDGRIRGNINFHITVTGRTSSDKPNMQNIPKGKTVTALAVKRVYMVEDDCWMVCADYSQAEVRWLAQITGDPLLKKAFDAVEKVQRAYLENPTEENRIRMVKEGDFHRQTASQIFQKRPEDVTDLERSAAKSIVFGIIYGMTEFGVAESLKISIKEAVQYRDQFLNQFPEARTWLSTIEEWGFDNGYVESPVGRRRHLVSGFVVTEDNETYITTDGRRFTTNIGSYHQYENRICRNSPIQSVASDTNLMACIQIQKYVERHQKPWKLLNTVHDSIIAEIPKTDIKEYIDTANAIMVNPDLMKTLGATMTIPFVADFTVGPNWADQVNVTVAEEYIVFCRDCKKEREERKKPTNKRCEQCGSKNVGLKLKSGPLEKVLRYLDWQAKQERTYG